MFDYWLCTTDFQMDTLYKQSILYNIKTDLVVVPVEFSSNIGGKKIYSNTHKPITSTIYTCKSKATNGNAPSLFVATDAQDIQNNV